MIKCREYMYIHMLALVCQSSKIKCWGECESGLVFLLNACTPRSRAHCAIAHNAEFSDLVVLFGSSLSGIDVFIWAKSTIADYIAGLQKCNPVFVGVYGYAGCCPALNCKITFVLKFLRILKVLFFKKHFKRGLGQRPANNLQVFYLFW